MTLTVLEVLYIALTAFVAVIGVLLSIVLYKLIKILNVVSEVTGYYNKAKTLLTNYSKIPDSVKSKVKSKLKK